VIISRAASARPVYHPSIHPSIHPRRRFIFRTKTRRHRVARDSSTPRAPPATPRARTPCSTRGPYRHHRHRASTFAHDARARVIHVARDSSRLARVIHRASRVHADARAHARRRA